jgi:hypothetical protein
MEKIRINMTLDADSDADLYHYLINVAARRRATLLRALAMQGLNGDHQLRAGITKTVSTLKPMVKAISNRYDLRILSN